MSRIVLGLCLIEAAASLLMGGSLIFSDSDPATVGLDGAAGIVLILVSAVFIGPAARLAYVDKGPRLALAGDRPWRSSHPCLSPLPCRCHEPRQTTT